MGGYLVNFSVYTFAMVGFLFLAVAIYKKSSLTMTKNGKDSAMVIEESLSLSPRKRLHVVRVNGEKFLIAADVDRTEFLAKLDSKEKSSLNENVIKMNNQVKVGNVSETVPVLKNVQNLIHGTSALKTCPIQYQETKLSHIKSINMKKTPVMRKLLNKLEVSKG